MTSSAQPSDNASSETTQTKKPDLNSFRSTYPAKPMNELAARYKNDCLSINAEQGLFEIEFPANDQVRVTARDEDDNVDFDGGRYLWAITEDNAVHALEITGEAIQVGGGCLKHSNLTGGQPANGGGELWYWETQKTILVNAHSGRYGNRGPGGVEMAQALVLALRDCGFKAATTGIERETNSLRAYPDPDAQLDF